MRNDCHAGPAFLNLFLADHKSSNIEHITYIDQAPEIACNVKHQLRLHRERSGSKLKSVSTIVADEEFLPIASSSHDCALLSQIVDAAWPNRAVMCQYPVTKGTDSARCLIAQCTGAAPCKSKCEHQKGLHTATLQAMAELLNPSMQD